MAKVIPEDKKIMADFLVNHRGYSTYKAAKLIGGVSRKSVSNYARQARGEEPVTERLRERAIRSGYKGLGDKKKKELGKRGLDNTSHRLMLLRQRGFSGVGEYREYLAQQKGYKSRQEREKSERREKTGLDLADYNTQLTHAKKRRPENKELIKIIKKFAKEKALHSWEIATILGISRDTFQKYMLGSCFPPPENLMKIYDLFGIKTNPILDKFLEEGNTSYYLRMRYGIKKQAL